MSKAHSIIKLLTFGALGSAAYLQAGSDPESANRLTIMLTSLLGTLSGEVGGGILDRALFDKEAKTHASAVADVVGEAFGKDLSQSQSMKMLVTAQGRAEATETEKRAKTRRRDYLLNKLLYLTGGRISEVLALRWGHIYATDKGGEMKIIHGKGRKERVINLPEELFEALQEMRAARRADDKDFVFTSQKGGQLSVSQAWRIVNALADEANVTKKVSPHTWRHSIATQLLDAGAPYIRCPAFSATAIRKSRSKHTTRNLKG
jgi:integrase